MSCQVQENINFYLSSTHIKCAWKWWNFSFWVFMSSRKKEEENTFLNNLRNDKKLRGTFSSMSILQWTKEISFWEGRKFLFKCLPSLFLLLLLLSNKPYGIPNNSFLIFSVKFPFFPLLYHFRWKSLITQFLGERKVFHFINQWSVNKNFKWGTKCIKWKKIFFFR